MMTIMITVSLKKLEKEKFLVELKIIAQTIFLLVKNSLKNFKACLCNYTAQGYIDMDVYVTDKISRNEIEFINIEMIL